MKKILLLVLCSLVFVGCEKVDKKYKEGTFEGIKEDTYGGQTNDATAKITVDSEGKITSVYLDTTYTTKAGVKTTKKALKYDYNMQKYAPEAKGEWFEQIVRLENSIVENQGTEFLKLDENGKTDTVSGCTIIIDSLTEAVNQAINKAKK